MIEFKKWLGGFPVIVGAGVTMENIHQYGGDANGFIVGSYFKDSHETNENLNPYYVEKFMAEHKRLYE